MTSIILIGILRGRIHEHNLGLQNLVRVIGRVPEQWPIPVKWIIPRLAVGIRVRRHNQIIVTDSLRKLAAEPWVFETIELVVYSCSM